MSNGSVPEPSSSLAKALVSLNYATFDPNSYMAVYDMTLQDYQVSNIASARIIANDMLTTNYLIDTTNVSNQTLIGIANSTSSTNKPLSNITSGATASVYAIALIKELTILLSSQQTTFNPTESASDDLKPYTFYTVASTLNPTTQSYVTSQVMVTLCKYRNTIGASRVVLMVTRSA